MTKRRQRPWLVRYTDPKGRVKTVTRPNVASALTRRRELARAGNTHIDIAPKEEIANGDNA